MREFLKNESAFLSYWNNKEQFVKYYIEEYKDQAGTQVHACNKIKLQHV